MSTAFSSLYARYYDILYRDKDYVAESAYFEKILKKHGLRRGSRILSFGAGTLNHEQFLADKAYLVHGVELSPDMVERARAKIDTLMLDRVSIEQGDMRTYVTKSVYDAVLIPFNVVSYCKDIKELDATCAAASRALRRGGVIAFDCWNGDAMRTHPPSDTWSKIPLPEGELYKLVRASAVTKQNTFVRSLELVAVESGKAETYHEDHVLSGWTPKQLKSTLARHGFKAPAIYEWMTMKPAPSSRWAIAVVATKK